MYFICHSFSFCMIKNCNIRLFANEYFNGIKEQYNYFCFLRSEKAGAKKIEISNSKKH